MYHTLAFQEELETFAVPVLCWFFSSCLALNNCWCFVRGAWIQDFYWDGYHIVREQAPHWLFLMHDSFNFDVNTWGDFMKNCPTIGLDTHIYQVPGIFHDVTHTRLPTPLVVCCAMSVMALMLRFVTSAVNEERLGLYSGYLFVCVSVPVASHAGLTSWTSVT